MDKTVDVLVIGGGNAGFTAAHAAREQGCSVLILEKAPHHEAGGKSFYTAGATRVAHEGLDDLVDLIEPDPRHEKTVVPPYSAQEYTKDLARVTEGKNDPELTQVLVTEGRKVLGWLKGLGMKYRLMYERQAYEVPPGNFVFWGGLHVGNVGGGEGLMEDHTAIAHRLGTEVQYGVRVNRFLTDRGRVVGVEATGPAGESIQIRAQSVILAAGGFESNKELRRRYLGEGWENAKVRGTPYNTGEMLMAALELGAQPGGDWQTAHSVQWDAFIQPNESNRELTNRLTRQSYPLGIIVNQSGRRFLDEGADFRNYTYAKYGAEILKEPGSVAYQVFDSSLRPMLRTEEYDMPGVSVAVADSLEELAAVIGVPADNLKKTITEFNDSIDRRVSFDPTVKDGRKAAVAPPKSNWAAPLEKPPYYAYAVTCGITFTFGGLKGDSYGRVIDEEGQCIPGLFVCGEMLGGLFSGNYPGGSGLAAGAVFGRRAGIAAAESVEAEASEKFEYAQVPRGGE